MSNDLTPAQSGNEPSLQTLVSQLRDLVRDARGRALQASERQMVNLIYYLARLIMNSMITKRSHKPDGYQNRYYLYG